MMASLGRSFKPSTYFSSVSRRPAGPNRSLSNMSNSSEVSPLSSPDSRPEDIVLSARPSPGLTTDNPQPPRSPHSYLRSSSTRSSPRSTNTDDILVAGPTKSTLPRSQPIAIELPAPKKVSSAPVYTPPAPLSARGDLPGGYFPLHEEQARVYRPHPFQLDATKAHLKSIQRASKNSPSSSIPPTSRTIGKGDVGPATTNVPPAKADRTMEMPQFNVGSLRRPELGSSSTTPVASYMPLGDRSSPLPMGKYYPSNYERRKDEKKGRHRSRTSDPTTASSSKSEVPVPHINQPSNTGHSRNESEAKRLLQQYQRDMIAQATIALNRGNPSQAALGPIRSLGFTNIINPSKPRLAPLGSPGPVTPMELEGSAGGYLEVHRAAEAQVELAPPNRDEEERIRIRQDGHTSPVVELGSSTL